MCLSNHSYDRGNLVLADSSYTILSLLRVFKYDDDVRVAVREKYPVQVAASQEDKLSALAAASGAAEAATDDAGGASDSKDGDASTATAATSSPLPTPEALHAFLLEQGTRKLTGKQKSKAALKQVLAFQGSGVSVYG